jgi:hypothetical protein
MKFVPLIVLGILVAATTSSSAGAFSGPAASLQHLFANEDCEPIPELPGDWTAHGDLDGTWTLEKFGDRNYRLIQKVGQSETSNKPAFDICVAHLGGYLFFDATFQELTPDGKRSVLGEDDNLFWIPLHLIGRLEIGENALHFRLLNDNWLQDELKSGRIHLSCSLDDEGQYLLTAPSQELKQFASGFAADPKVFSHTEDFARAPAQEATHPHPHWSPRTEGSSGVVAVRDKRAGNLP